MNLHNLIPFCQNIPSKVISNSLTNSSHAQNTIFQKCNPKAPTCSLQKHPRWEMLNQFSPPNQYIITKDINYFYLPNHHMAVLLKEKFTKQRPAR